MVIPFNDYTRPVPFVKSKYDLIQMPAQYPNFFIHPSSIVLFFINMKICSGMMFLLELKFLRFNPLISTIKCYSSNNSIIKHMKIHSGMMSLLNDINSLLIL